MRQNALSLSLTRSLALLDFAKSICDSPPPSRGEIIWPASILSLSLSLRPPNNSDCARNGDDDDFGREAENNKESTITATA